MKIGIVNYTLGGMALEIIGETDVEYMLLRQIWGHGKMSRGDGETITPDKMSTGFYLNPDKSEAT